MIGATLLLSVLATMLGNAEPVVVQGSFFEEGNRQYQSGDYDAALDSYLQIFESGFESGALHYNIGNCYFKQGDLGRSILFYERALVLDPRDDDARANLELARSLTADEITPLPGFWVLRVVDWWVHALSGSLLVAIVGFSYLVGTTALIAVILSRSRILEMWGRGVAIVSGVLVLVFGVNLVALELGLGEPIEAIVLAEEVSVQSAPSDDLALQVFTIHEGTKMRIDQQSGDWAEIVLADGKVGWVRVEVLEII
ncbi:tetratricopeptide repeat protein [Gemmatimonadota bacterium]